VAQYKYAVRQGCSLGLETVSRRSFQTSRSRLGLVETWEGLGLDLVSDWKSNVSVSSQSRIIGPHLQANMHSFLLHCKIAPTSFLANVNSCSRSLLCCRPSVCRLSVCRLCVTLVHPTQAVEIFGNISTACGTLANRWRPWKILWRSFQGEPLRLGELNTAGVAKYRDFGPIEGHISETVQDRRQVSSHH